MQTVLGNRYQLQQELGSGGMGVVYRAADRLIGETVALKRVGVAPGRLAFNSRNDTSDLRVALAREFQLLASLRHPNVIGVLDYGFDSDGQPYFTMSLLDQPRDILEAARDLDDTARTLLLAQMLQALAYLHRRGLLHRDLKPGNVLVTDDGQVKVLDFGLAVPVYALSNVEDVVAGTMAYIAPELFLGQLPSVASDLYAVGVIACEVYRGDRPFDDSSVAKLIDSILTKPPDLSGIPLPLQAVVERLLAKTPDQRYPNADAAIVALCAAAGQPVPAESQAVRESFLQAAQFVGREAEFGELTRALKAVLSPSTSADGNGLQNHPFPPLHTLERGPEGEDKTPRGSAWLIGGESGVGKSRLLHEVRTRALVEGVLVLHGQSVAEGGLPYQLWRDPLRRLALAVNVSAVEASILKIAVPDIADLLGCDVPDAPVMDGKPAQQRLALTITGLMRRLRQPTLLLLEDLHWAGADLEIVRAVNRLVADCPLLILGSYRNDEQPSLPDELPGMRVLMLERLPDSAIARLSESMLGEAGQQPHVLELLRRETEGNAFFLVEVVRALAEEAGRLGDIGRRSLPEKVLTGGVQQIVRRRLGRVPAAARPLLKLAAVAGRQIDEPVMEKLVGTRSIVSLQPLTLDNWLTACANAAVLDRQDGRWRFSHDKLRETLLADLSPDELPALNRQVAEAIEAAYPGDDSRAAALADHWYAAGDVAKTVQYSRLAARQLNAVSNFRAARRLCDRALALLAADDSARVPLLALAAEACVRLTEFDQGAAYATQALALARQANDRANEAAVLRIFGNAAMNQGDYAEARARILESLELSRQLDDRRGIGLCQNTLGTMAIAQGNHDEARAYFGEALVTMRELDERRVIAVILHNLGYLAYTEGDNAAARAYLEDSRAAQRTLGDQIISAQSLLLLGMVAFALGDYDAAQTHAGESMAIQRNIGDRRSLSDSLCILGWVAEARGDLAAAQDYYDQALAISRDIGNRQGIGYCLNNVASLARKLGDYETAQARADEAIATFEGMGDRRGLGYSLNARALVAYSQGSYATALDYASRSHDTAANNDDRLLQAAAAVTRAFIHLATGNRDSARPILREGLQAARRAGAVSVILELLAGVARLRRLDGQAAAAAELVGAIQAHPLSGSTDVIGWLALVDLDAALSPDERQAAIERGRQQDAMTLAAQFSISL
ncbi:MAG: tetratricopeptide repeat protein [Chloroflexi bacterium]|nr:tetratricopeptide repeat protein [Chloroflexota bacterium]